MRAFQQHRGLHEHGTCDESTWLALVEASWRLGDRPLKLIAPNMRGDDVGALQSQLGRLGFDCGRVDGIFGHLTDRALQDFQRNCGLEGDGICGPATARALDAISSQTGSGPGVATLREIEQLGSVGASLPDMRIVVGQFGGLSSLTRSVAQELRAGGAKVIAVDELDPSFQAAAANRHAASVYIGFEAHAEPTATMSYYSTEGFESAGGRSLACQLASRIEETGVLPRPPGRRDAPAGAPRDAHDRRRLFARSCPAGHRRGRRAQRRGDRRARRLGAVADVARTSRDLRVALAPGADLAGRASTADGNVHLLRHAESEWNRIGRWQGTEDPPLSDRGRRASEPLSGVWVVDSHRKAGTWTDQIARMGLSTTRSAGWVRRRLHSQGCSCPSHWGKRGSAESYPQRCPPAV